MGSTTLDMDTQQRDLERVWAERWPRHHGQLVRYASHLLDGDSTTAEDVVQETAIRLLRHPEVLTGERPIGAWLRTVARNIVVDRVRRRRARPTEVSLAPGVDRESPDDLEQIESEAAMAGLLSGLSSHHRTVVLEVYVRDRPVAEVASDLGIPAGTVKSRCHTALRQLRETVSPAGPVHRPGPSPIC